LSELIEKCFPGFHVRRRKQILTGWDSIVLEVNGEWIFRFPRFKISERNLRKEISLLPIISRHLSVAVPKYEYVWNGNKAYPRYFGGYKKIGGVALTVGGFRLDWIRGLSDTISRFLKDLHSVRMPSEELASLQRYSVATWTENYRRTYRRVRRLVYPLLDSDTRQRAQVLWHEVLEGIEKADFEPVLIHGDLTSRNILLDPVTGKITGILDWIDSMVG